MQQQQQAAPLADVDQQRQEQFRAMTSGPPAAPYSAFGPSQRPMEPITAGINLGPGQGAPIGGELASDTDLLLQAMIRVYPHPTLMALLDRGS